MITGRTRSAPVRSMFCHLCGRKITAEGKSFRHKNWPRNLSLQVCADCIRTRPRCRACDMPMAQDTINGICETCSRTMRFCLTCGSPVHGAYLEYDGIGPYCQACVRDRPPCDVCSAPLTDDQWRLSDGRVLCAHCHASAIYTVHDAVSLYEEMKAVVDSLLGFTLNVPTGLALVDRNQLAEVIHQQMQPMAPSPRSGRLVPGSSPSATPPVNDLPAINDGLDPQRTLGIYTRRGMRRGIYVQTGLPRMLFLQVAAHEFAHAWQGENCPLLRTVLLHEGFAEWVAYRVLGHYRYSRGQGLMLARQDIYGQGLRWALELEAGQGPAAVIEACRKSI